MLVTVIANEKCDYVKSKMRYKWKILCAIDDSPEKPLEPIHMGVARERASAHGGMGKVNFLVMQNKYYETYYAAMSLCGCVFLCVGG